MAPRLGIPGPTAHCVTEVELAHGLAFHNGTHQTVGIDLLLPPLLFAHSHLHQDKWLPHEQASRNFWEHRRPLE